MLSPARGPHLDAYIPVSKARKLTRELLRDLSQLAGEWYQRSKQVIACTHSTSYALLNKNPALLMLIRGGWVVGVLWLALAITCASQEVADSDVFADPDLETDYEFSVSEAEVAQLEGELRAARSSVTVLEERLVAQTERDGAEVGDGISGCML